MRYFYMAVSVVVESDFVVGDNGDYAYIVKFAPHEDVKFILDRIKGIKLAFVCTTKKKAQELVKAWNESYKQNGTYAFSYPTF